MFAYLYWQAARIEQLAQQIKTLEADLERKQNEYDRLLDIRMKLEAKTSQLQAQLESAAVSHKSLSYLPQV